MADQPHILLLNVDQWRGDCLSIDGHPVVQTPYLDSLAAGGTRFSRAYAATPTCIPARAALHTGLSPRSHGRVGYQDGVPWNYPVTMAGEFTRGGYQTQAIGKMHVYPERSQLGFQNVLLHDGYLHFARDRAGNLDSIDDYLPWLRRELGREADYFDHGLGCNSHVARPWDKAEYLHPTNWVVSQGIEFLKRRDPRKPFFLYLSFHRPHPPYDPPTWAFEQYINSAMPTPPVGDWTEMFAAHNDAARADCNVGDISAARLQRARAGYYGHMTHIDHQLNRFFEHLAQFGVRDNTFICFVSDHGELMGDHHLFRKSLPYEGSARVPLILHGPRNSRIRAGGVSDAVVELRDIMPTLLDCAGLPIPAEVEGRSLLPLARGQEASVREVLHGEHLYGGQSVQWLTDGKEKYIWFSGTGREQLFDLAQDPQERHDLAPQCDAERLAWWRQRLIEELAGREEGYTDGASLLSGRPVAAVLSHVRTGAAAQ